MTDFPELSHLQKVLELAKDKAEIRVLGQVEARGKQFPIYSLVIGSQDRTKPTFGLFGGVHGLERIGSQVVIAFLESFFQQLSWDRDLDERLKNVRIATIPIVNPAGMYFGRRSNMNGVDLMRNAPVEALLKPKWLIGGHRISPRLPWYRGAEGSGMELEAQTLVDFVKQELFESRAVLVLDAHSGFGLKDRLWYPYAKTSDPFPRLTEVQAFASLLDRSFPNHVYTIEPQSLNYTTHGDLWDYMFDEHALLHGQKAPLFLPWTLEMGSWLWVRKNPIQLISSMGMFNPVKAHRIRRALRRHIPLLDFFMRAVKYHDSWGGAAR